MGGSWYNQPGGASNYLCLHSQPIVGSGNVAGVQPITGLLVGVEYELVAGYTNDKPFSYANNGNNDLHDNDAVCAVCYNSEVEIQVMTPGRPDCPSRDMRLEYKGYLMSNHYGGDHFRGEYICVDGAPEVRPGGQANRNGDVIYPVQADCNSALACPPYATGDEIQCSVCTL